MKRAVLDANAVTGLFEMRPGSQIVEQLIEDGLQGRAVLLMSSVNLGEVFYSAWLRRGARDAQQAMAELDQWPMEIVAADREQAIKAAELKARYKLPYADAFAAALALAYKAEVVTEDPHFRVVEDFVKILWLR